MIIIDDWLRDTGTAETVKTNRIKIKNKDVNCMIPKILLIGVFI